MLERLRGDDVGIPWYYVLPLAQATFDRGRFNKVLYKKLHKIASQGGRYSLQTGLLLEWGKQRGLFRNVSSDDLEGLSTVKEVRFLHILWTNLVHKQVKQATVTKRTEVGHSFSSRLCSLSVMLVFCAFKVSLFGPF